MSSYVYIYDKQGIELHCLKTHHQVCGLDFLPYHFLLVSVNKRGFLQYTDTSTGEQIASICTRLGRTHCLTHNTHNGIVHVGHSNGTVTLWSPNTPEPLVKMLCHRGPIKSMVIDSDGQYMITGGVDSKVRIWDVRTYKSLGEIKTFSPATTMCLSQRNILAIGSGRKIVTYHEPFSKDLHTPFMKHYCDDVINSIEFCPYEDVLGIGHGAGFSSILIPGSAEPNIDSLEANPYQTKSQRREHEVKMLLEKIQSELISLKADSIKNIADMTQEELVMLKQKEEEAVKTAKRADFRKRGKSGALKQINTMEKRAKKQEISFKKQKEARKNAILKKKRILEGNYSVLDRFK
ncbi:U3 small nucleolar RNA-associated protein 7 [Oopsacas minuta]|uniref:U3 small nucleolar RNA-associated protein 7 n=1 Tax=Oopsacas minuta TaxID=111878 RepID=A0AAV7JRN6_9METZ|nr:U3 small nucleolar RNA-associated protein 7 [Oopsacas minuta]